jgi:hypothetical protein
MSRHTEVLPATSVRSHVKSMEGTPKHDLWSQTVTSINESRQQSLLHHTEQQNGKCEDSEHAALAGKPIFMARSSQQTS